MYSGILRNRVYTFLFMVIVVSDIVVFHVFHEVPGLVVGDFVPFVEVGVGEYTDDRLYELPELVLAIAMHLLGDERSYVFEVRKGAGGVAEGFEDRDELFVGYVVLTWGLAPGEKVFVFADFVGDGPFGLVCTEEVFEST